MKFLPFIFVILLFASCQKEVKKTKNPNIILSGQLKNNVLVFDIDGDKTNDTIELVQNKINSKTGLRILFGSDKNEKYFGMGNNVLQQDFFDLDWVTVFEKAPKGTIYWNNVKDGVLLTDDQIKEQDKIRLPNDAIFLHAAENEGGGIIYFDKGEFKWIQRE